MGENDDLPSIEGLYPSVDLQATFKARVEMFEPLLAACPSFLPAWEAFLAEWRDEPVDLPTYLALSDLAHHLDSMMERGETEAFPAIFEVVEQWHLSADPYIKEAATIGLLESLYEGSPETPFEPWMRPVTSKWWRKLHAFWSEGVIMQDD